MQFVWRNLNWGSRHGKCRASICIILTVLYLGWFGITHAQSVARSCLRRARLEVAAAGAITVVIILILVMVETVGRIKGGVAHGHFSGLSGLPIQIQVLSKAGLHEVDLIQFMKTQTVLVIHNGRTIGDIFFGGVLPA